VQVEAAAFTVTGTPCVTCERNLPLPALSARRIASSALRAITLVLGVAAPVALAADTARARTHEAAPVIDAATLQTQVQQLGYLGTLVPPIADVRVTVAEDDHGA
jgi:hypothetical protein